MITHCPDPVLQQLATHPKKLVGLVARVFNSLQKVKKLTTISVDCRLMDL